MINALRRWCRWFFTAPTTKIQKRIKCHYTADQWAFLRNAKRGDLRGLACHWGRSRSAIYEAWRKAQRAKDLEPPKGEEAGT